MKRKPVIRQQAGPSPNLTQLPCPAPLPKQKFALLWTLTNTLNPPMPFCNKQSQHHPGLALPQLLLCCHSAPNSPSNCPHFPPLPPLCPRCAPGLYAPLVCWHRRSISSTAALRAAACEASSSGRASPSAPLPGSESAPVLPSEGSMMCSSVLPGGQARELTGEGSAHRCQTYVLKSHTTLAQAPQQGCCPSAGCQLLQAARSGVASAKASQVMQSRSGASVMHMTSHAAATGSQPPS